MGSEDEIRALFGERRLDDLLVLFDFAMGILSFAPVWKTKNKIKMNGFAQLGFEDFWLHKEELPSFRHQRDQS